jgi:DNA-binding XRE family transcriptional regulator
VAASTLLRAARSASNLKQSALASGARASQAEVSAIENGKRNPTVDTLDRLLAKTGHRLIAIRTDRPDVVTSAARIAMAVKRGDRESALRAFLDYSDGLASKNGVDRVVLAASEPHATGSDAWDAALAAVTELRLDEGKVPKPDWITTFGRQLKAPASPHLTAYDLPPDVELVPPEFLRRNVLIERGTLESV